MAFRGKLIASGADAKTTKGNGDKYGLNPFLVRAFLRTPRL